MTHGRALLLSALLQSALLLPSPAAGDDTLVQQGVTQFNLGRFSRSERTFARALNQAHEPGQIARILLHLGQLYAVQGKPVKAASAFRAALEQDPLVRLNPGETKHSTLDLFRRTRQGLRGVLEVTASHPGAQLELDGGRPVPLPYRRDVSIGKHTLQVWLPGGLYQRFRTEVLVGVARMHEVSATLVAYRGRLDLTSQPPGARVTCGGKVLGKTPLAGIVLPVGEHAIRLQHAGHLPLNRRIRIRGGKNATVAVRLEPLPVVHRGPVKPSARKGISGPRLAAWITAGAAVAAAGATMGLGIWTYRTSQQYEAAAANGNGDRYAELKQAGAARQVATNVALGGALALGATAALLYLFGDRIFADRAGATGPAPMYAPAVPGSLRVEF